jgi:hypothetical protein
VVIVKRSSLVTIPTRQFIFGLLSPVQYPLAQFRCFCLLRFKVTEWKRQDSPKDRNLRLRKETPNKACVASAVQEEQVLKAACPLEARQSTPTETFKAQNTADSPF